MDIKYKSIALGVVAILILAGGLAAVNAVKPVGNGNGAPSGKHYNINIIGVPNDKNENFDGGNGARIFVDRTGKTFFYVGASDHFEIFDHDATDGVCGWHGDPPAGIGDENVIGQKGFPGIVFPYDYGQEEWKVKIYVRLLGPPDSSIRWKTYVFEETDGSLGYYRLVYNETWDRDTKFSLKTGALLWDGYEDILWEMSEKNNFRILQMRIYLE